jgi:hypothetical protein
MSACCRLGPLLLLSLLGGCGLDDSAVVECRCTPETNLSLFPQCRESLLTERADSGSPFATQTPDCPSGQRISLLEPTRPEFVLANLRTLFQARPEVRNPDQYLDMFTQDFSFVPDEQDVQLHPEVYDASRDTIWNLEQERSFAQAILDPDRIQTISFIRWYESANDERIVSEDQRHETFVFPYEAEFNEKVQADEPPSVLAIKGWMEVDLVTQTVENPVWAIEQWRDRRDLATAKRSWGELRAEFAR